MGVEVPVDVVLISVEIVTLSMVALPHVASVGPEVREEDGRQGGEIILVVDDPEMTVALSIKTVRKYLISYLCVVNMHECSI